jgi:hypothetical protein
MLSFLQLIDEAVSSIVEDLGPMYEKSKDPELVSFFSWKQFTCGDIRPFFRSKHSSCAIVKKPWVRYFLVYRCRGSVTLV